MRTLKILALVSVLFFGLSCKKGTDPDTPNYLPIVNTGNAHLDSVLNNTPVETISVEEEEALKLMREEEKLARDLYLNAFDQWNLNIFQNISGSEQMHMDAIKGLLIKYNITDPVVNDGRGIFTNALIDSIYLVLNQQQLLSKIDALKMGAFVEEFDIHDLRELKANEVDNIDITLIFNELERGSRNHLRSFYNNLQNQGVTYTPQILTKTEFDDIVNSPHETGGGW